MNTKRNASCIVAILALATTYPSALYGQNDSLVLEEIVVTATKRAENVQDVPIAVSVIDADTIDAMGIGQFTDVEKLSPSLTVSRGDWATNSSFNLRGVGTQVFSINIDPSVAVIVDDVPLVRTEQAFSDLSDIQSIEILRGPQSTLFGKSASAGVINIRTKRPGREPISRVSFGFTEDDEQTYSLVYSRPVSESAGIRYSAYYKDRPDGHIRNIDNNDDVNGSRSGGFRIKMAADVSDTVTTDFTVAHHETDSNCCHRPLRALPDDSRFLGNPNLPASVAIPGIMPGEENVMVAVDDPTMDESSSDMVTLRVDADLGEYHLLSITSGTIWEYEVTTDVDGTAFGFASGGGINQGGGFDLDAITQEFRLVSPVSDTFDYVAGFFYSDIKYGRSFRRGPLFAADWSADTGSETIALYARGTWHISPSTELTAGIRLNQEEISHDFRNQLAGTRFAGDDSDTAVPGTISLQHYLNNDVMLFASYSIGYKGQGYDISSSFGEFSRDNPVGTEDSQAFELGMKGIFADGRVQVNPTLFLVRYDDFQAQLARIVGGAVELGITNVGELETSGIEIDMQARLTENLKLVGGLAWVNAEIKTFPGANCYPSQTAALGCTMNPVTMRNAQDLSGADLNNSPDFKLTLSAEYEHPFPSMPFDGYLNISLQWQSEAHFGLLNDPGTQQDGYGVVNLSLGIAERESQGYEVSLFVNNLFDEFYVSRIDNVGALWGQAAAYSHVVPRGAQRYGGIRLRYSF